MSKKPIIRHCRNCEYGKLLFCNSIECTVTYKHITYNSDQRQKALFCRHYKQKEVQNE